MRMPDTRRLGLFVLGITLLAGGEVLAEGPLWRVAADGESLAPSDPPPLRTYNDAYHPWAPPESAEEWPQVARRIRQQLLVSQGLWPMPPKLPLEPVVHGLIDEGDYTVEKVYFKSLPGHYVTGNLYRPKNGAAKRPGVLCPHGHWANGRFVRQGDAVVAKELESGAEKLESAARSPVQARMVHLARMGCTVFHYDMVGYADSQAIPHRQGFADAEAGLRMQNFMGLQTFNSIRALDFLMSLPDVDSERIGVTGSSGGGTQTFILCAIDERPDVAFPAVMVGTAMQGGCVCENAPYLRHSINNVAFAALAAPRPMALSGADDWTIDIETKGLPELKQVYGFFGAAAHVHAKCYPQFGHNFNSVSRRMMYEWFKQHLDLEDDAPLDEREFRLLTAAEMSVYNDEHPRPDEATAAGVRDWLTKVSDEARQGWLPSGEGDLERYRNVVGVAARVLLDANEPVSVTAEERRESAHTWGNVEATAEALIVQQNGDPHRIPVVRLVPQVAADGAVVWIDGAGKQELFDDEQTPNGAILKLLAAGREVWLADLRGTGELVAGDEVAISQEVNETYAGYTFCYNPPLVAKRAREIRAVMAACRETLGSDAAISLAGSGAAGPWCVLAAAVSETRLAAVAADVGGFDFAEITQPSDADYLPGALKYGGLAGIGGLIAPARLTLFGVAETETADIQAVYRAAERSRLTIHQQPGTVGEIADGLLER